MSVKARDNTPEVLRAVRKMSFDTLVEFTEVARSITVDNAPVGNYPGSSRRGGNHRSNIEMDSTKGFGGRAQTRIFSSAGYGAYLEFGTSKMAARPHFSKGIKGAINQFKDQRRWKT